MGNVSWWGTVSGVAAGFAVGSVVPGIGNVVGAVIGGVAGFAHDVMQTQTNLKVAELKEKLDRR